MISPMKIFLGGLEPWSAESWCVRGLIDRDNIIDKYAIIGHICQASYCRAIIGTVIHNYVTQVSLGRVLLFTPEQRF